MVRAGSDVFAVMIQALLLTGAAFLLWFAALGNQPSERTKLARTLQIGAVVGGIAFVAGFFGPLLFSPGSNQGPCSAFSSPVPQASSWAAWWPGLDQAFSKS